MWYNLEQSAIDNAITLLTNAVCDFVPVSIRRGIFWTFCVIEVENKQRIVIPFGNNWYFIVQCQCCHVWLIGLYKYSCLNSVYDNFGFTGYVAACSRCGGKYDNTVLLQIQFWVQQWKHFENRSTFVEVVAKITQLPFLTHSVMAFVCIVSVRRHFLKDWIVQFIL